MQHVLGTHTLETVKRDLEKAAQGLSTRTSSARAEAFWFLSYARLTVEAKAYLQQYVKGGA
jgi:hypothetical protein